MSKTYTFAVSNVAKAAIIVQGPCQRIALREDASVANWPTQGFQLFAPTSSDLPVQYVSGEWIPLQVEARFVPGQTIGYIQALTAPTTVSQRED